MKSLSQVYPSRINDNKFWRVPSLLLVLVATGCLDSKSLRKEAMGGSDKPSHVSHGEAAVGAEIFQGKRFKGASGADEPLSLQKLPGEESLAPTAPLAVSPEAPSLLRKIHEVDVERYSDGSVKRSKNLWGYPTTFYRTIRPAMPPIRTTYDGRLGMNWKTERLYLLAPERITQPFTFSEPGLGILVNPYGSDSFAREFLSKPGETGGDFAGVAICNHVKASLQPRPCGADDCYDLTYVGFRTSKSEKNSGSNFDEARFRSRRVVVKVRSPKTLNPEVISVEINGPLLEKPKSVYLDLEANDTGRKEHFYAFEPTTTLDGRLFVARAGFAPSKDIDGVGQGGAKPYQKNVDLFYMVQKLKASDGTDTEPCDARYFSDIKRIQKAPKDPEMRDPEELSGRPRYGIAQYPMRDSFGRLIPDDGLFPTYPWVDREGNNIFFSTGSSSLFSYDYGSPPVAKPVLEPERQGSLLEPVMNPGSARYPVRCSKLAPNCEESPYNPENPDKIKGFAMLGSWTHGKTVVLDGLINASDYGLNRGLQFHRELQLYQPTEAFDGWVHVGPGRTSANGSGINNEIESLSEDAEILGMTVGTGVIDSVENAFNAFPNLRPSLTRDVVWHVNYSLGTEEVAFDDYMDPRALIVSTMIPGVEYGAPSEWFWHYRDGFGWGGSFKSPEKQNEPVLIQNAATSETLPIPSYGYLSAGRVEPVALGGVHGRGLWLTGQNRVTYQFPTNIPSAMLKRIAAGGAAQPAVTPGLFFTILFDNRSTDEKQRQLLQFPDGTRLSLSPSKITIQSGNINKALTVNTSRKGWSHLGVSVSLDGKTSLIYLNGMLLGKINTGNPIFRISKGANGEIPVLRIGQVGTGANRLGFRGWIDDFKLFAYQPTAEVICNHAYGSLHWVTDRATAEWKEIADRYPSFSHSSVLSELPASYIQRQSIPANAKFVCTADYTDAMGIYRARGREKEGLHSLREAILFRVPKTGGADDGQLSWNSKRSSFLNNAFCLSCHTQESKGRFGLAALAPGEFCELRDPRRQPLQAPRYLGGQVTEAFLKGIGSEAVTRPRIVDPESQALFIDPLIMNMASDASNPACF